MFDERDLSIFYQTNFNLMYFHRYSLSDIEAMYPFERAVYIQLLTAQKEKERQEAQRRT